MCNNQCFRECPPRSAIELLAEAEARKKKRDEEKRKMVKDMLEHEWKEVF